MNHKEVFCFGSNTAGIHGAGAAKEAFLKHGAKYGIGYGLCFDHNGASFAIPTKDRHIQTLPTAAVERFVTGFLAFAESRPDLTFKVTRIGCGLAGFRDRDIAPMFVKAPSNCLFDDKWQPVFDYLIHKYPYDWEASYWGTYG